MWRDANGVVNKDEETAELTLGARSHKAHGGVRGLRGSRAGVESLSRVCGWGMASVVRDGVAMAWQDSCRRSGMPQCAQIVGSVSW